MALYGDNLAKSFRAGSTYQQATDALAALEAGLRACYSSFSLWDNWKASGTADTVNLAILSAIAPNDATAAKAQVDDDLARTLALDTLIQQAPDWSAAVSTDDLATMQDRLKVGSDTCAMVDSLFHTSVAAQVSDAIVPVVGSIGDQIGNAVSKLLGNFLGGIWWILVGGVVVVVVWRRWGRKAAA